jgi:CheY-like chemotaxis protein
MTLCLIVDDDKMSCKIAADIAGEMGLQVAVENNGMSALSYCNGRLPDIIILDINMPRMDGIAFLHELHRMIGGRSVYVIACTARSDIETVKALKNENVNAYVVKPFSADTLKAKLKESGKL